MALRTPLCDGLEIDYPPVGIEEFCPFCEREALKARSTDNVVTVACANCERTLLELGFPSAGLEGHGTAFPVAFEHHHCHRGCRVGESNADSATPGRVTISGRKTRTRSGPRKKRERTVEGGAHGRREPGEISGG